MPYSILIAGAITAKHIDALNKSCKCESALENANVVRLTELSTATSEDEVYIAATPISGSLDTDVFYMVNDPVNVLVNSIYAGLIDDPREFSIAANKVFAAYKPMVGDEVVVSVDGFTGTRVAEKYAIPADGDFNLNFSDSISSVSLAYEIIDTYNIPVGNERVSGFKLKCVKAS